MIRVLMLAVCVLAVGFVCSGEIYAQDAGTLAAALDKNKYKKKDKSKNGIDISIEIYIDIKNEPVVKEPSAYSGSYSSGDNGCSLDLTVSADGSAQGRGIDVLNTNDDDVKTAYTLRNGRVNGAVLTAEKVYADGRSEPFEAVFVNRTTSTGKNADNIESRKTEFGIGFVQKNKDWTNRVFLAAR